MPVRNPLSRKQKHRPAFTILELLVVISIMALLMSILVPSLNKAREIAKRAVCASNLRQLYVANSSYAINNNDHYVLAAEDIWSTNLHRWHGSRKSVNKPFDPKRGPLSAYLDDGEVKRCPAFKRNYLKKAGQHAANFEAGCGGYGYNDEYIGGRNDLHGTGRGSEYSARNFDIKRPASTVMFTDSAYRQRAASGDAYIEYSFAHPPYWTWYIRMLATLPDGFPIDGINGRPDPSIHFRHDRFTNVCWADCHISKETMDLTAPYATHAIMTEEQTAKMSLGWFGPDDNSLFDLK